MSTATLVAIAGASNANAYCDLVWANQYHDNRPAVGVTWASAVDDTKTKAILWATMLMDNMWTWNGFVSNTVQHLLWPRQGILKRNMFEYVDITVVPDEIKNATAEYARQLLVSDLMGNNDIETLKITSLKAGPVAFTFGDGVVAKPVPDAVFNLIPVWWGTVRGRVAGYRSALRA